MCLQNGKEWKLKVADIRNIQVKYKYLKYCTGVNVGYEWIRKEGSVGGPWGSNTSKHIM